MTRLFGGIGFSLRGSVAGVYSPDRIKYPMKRVERNAVKERFKRISWDEATAFVQRN